MELVITKSNLKKAAIKTSKKEEFVRGNLLNSNYKRIAENNLINPNPESIYGLRQLVKNRSFKSVTSIDTILKVVVFMTLLGFII